MNINEKDPFGTLYQGIDADLNPDSEGKFVPYRASWVIVAYINFMTSNDDTDTVKIKTIISYLHNNACKLNNVSGWNLKNSAPYWADILVFDLYHKIEPLENISLSQLIDGYYRKGCLAETMLNEAYRLGDNPSQLLNYLSITENEFYKPKTVLMTPSSGNGYLTNDSTNPKITFEDDLPANWADYKTSTTRANMWFNEKPNNNEYLGQGVSIYDLNTHWFLPGGLPENYKYINQHKADEIDYQKTKADGTPPNPQTSSILFFNVIRKAEQSNKWADINSDGSLGPLNEDVAFNNELAKVKADDDIGDQFLNGRPVEGYRDGIQTNILYGTVYDYFIGSDRKYIYVRKSTTAPNILNNGGITTTNVYKEIPTKWVITEYYSEEFDVYDNYINYESNATIGHDKNGPFEWIKARSNTRPPYSLPNSGETHQDHYIVSLGGIGKTKTDAFYSIVRSDETTPDDTLTLKEHSFLSKFNYGEDTGDSDDILRDWTIRDATIELTSGDDIYIAPQANSSNNNNSSTALPHVELAKKLYEDYKGIKGTDPRLRPILTKMWESVGVTGTKAEEFIDTKKFWSSAFIGYVMKTSGYSSFPESTFHNTSLVDIRDNNLNEFKAYKANEAILSVGDIVYKNRGTNHRLSTVVKGSDGHSDIVVRIENNKAYTIGGNLSEKIGSTAINLENGKIKDTKYFAVVRVKPKTTNTTTGSNVATPGSIQTGNTADFWSLLAICALEDGYPQGRADVAQSIYNRVGSPMYKPTISEVIKSKGSYAPAFANRTGEISQNFANIKDKATAIKALAEKKYKQSSDPIATATKVLKETWEALKDTTNQNKAKQLIEGRTDFKAESEGSVTSRNANLNPDGRGKFVQRKSRDNVYGWSYNYTDNITYGPPLQTFWDLGSNSF